MADDRPVILIVEDEPLIAMLLEDVLENAGFCAISLPDAARALGHLEQHGVPDLILSDQTMPGMTGTAMAAEIHQRYGAVPILIASGMTEGIEPHYPTLRKPFVEAEVLVKVNALLGRAVRG